MKLDEFIQQFKIQLGAEMLSKHRIYLDTKYWIILREAASGNAPSVHIDIYNKLNNLVKSNRAICPISSHSFFELLKIGDNQKRFQTASVMDELSRHIAFMPPDKIPGQELICFIRDTLNTFEGRACFNPAKYVWTKTGFICGEFIPYLEHIPASQTLKLQIEFYKHVADLSLLQILQHLDKHTNAFSELCKASDYTNGSLVRTLNEGKDRNQDFTTFDDVFMQEIAGILESLSDDIKVALNYLYCEQTGKTVSEELTQGDAVRQIQSLIYHAYRLKKLSKQLPYIHIQASLHAFIRYNKTQRFANNDLIDISHAAWALPYCQAFLLRDDSRIGYAINLWHFIIPMVYRFSIMRQMCLHI